MVKPRKRKTRPWRQELHERDKVEETAELWLRASLWSQLCGDPEDSLSGIGQFSVLQETPECLICLDPEIRDYANGKKFQLGICRKLIKKF